MTVYEKEKRKEIDDKRYMTVYEKGESKEMDGIEDT